MTINWNINIIIWYYQLQLEYHHYFMLFFLLFMITSNIITDYHVTGSLFSVKMIWWHLPGGPPSKPCALLRRLIRCMVPPAPRMPQVQNHSDSDTAGYPENCCKMMCKWCVNACTIEFEVILISSAIDSIDWCKISIDFRVSSSKSRVQPGGCLVFCW